MPIFYIHQDPTFSIEDGHLIARSEDISCAIAWSRTQRILRAVNSLAAEFEQHTRKVVVPACAGCKMRCT